MLPRPTTSGGAYLLRLENSIVASSNLYGLSQAAAGRITASTLRRTALASLRI